MALTGITNTFVAQLWGKEDRRGCARATTQGMILALLSLPFIALLEPVGLLLLNISGHPPEVLALEAEYFSILMWGGGGIVLSSAISSFFGARMYAHRDGLQSTRKWTEYTHELLVRIWRAGLTGDGDCWGRLGECDRMLECTALLCDQLF